ncbi:glycosyltransferase [Cohnella herbarum]|uniref:Glycosyltransferase n=1 Tax=Cohnella herbarum TaxID=2728023 RepID=A0A7Z2VLL8_9BACL|nr:glycosyltransferase [Cohnella herbarum]QJD85210.1 glycosyltransferase [Cohnella herbarum]
MMKQILMMSPYLLYPVTFGGQSRMLSVVQLLEASGSKIDFFMFNSPPKDGEICLETIQMQHPSSSIFLAEPDRSHYQDYFEKVLPHVTVPDPVLRFCSQQTQDHLATVLSEQTYDLIVMEHSYFGSLISFIRERSEARIILDLHNIEARFYESTWQAQDDFFEKMKQYLNWKRMDTYERETYPLYDHCFALSTIEMDMFKEMAPKVGVSFIPTGIETSSVIPSDYRGQSILFTGDMGYLPNIQGISWFADRIWPQIRDQADRLLIVGRNPSPELVNQYAHDDRIVFLGFQKDLTPYIHESRAFIVPIFSGAGARIKLLTGWATSLPMISTTFGAEGIQYKANENILIADDKESYIYEIKRVLSDVEYAHRIGSSGREWVWNNYDNQVLSSKVTAVIGKL